MLKKIIASLLALSICAVITSCDSNGNSSAGKSDADSSAQISSSDGTDASGETESTESSSQVSYDFSGIDSEKAIKLLTSDKYHLKFTADVKGESMGQEIFYTKNGILVNVDFMKTEYSILFKDNIQYTIIDDIYYEAPVDDTNKASVDMFEDYGYVSSGETELDGKTYKYDEFYQGTTGAYSKFIMDNGKLYAIQNYDDSVMMIEALDDSFDDSTISVPEGAKKVSPEEFNTIFLQKVSDVEVSES